MKTGQLQTPDLEDCASRASDFLDENRDVLKNISYGYVMVFGSRAFGWASRPNPEDYRTGVVAVSVVTGLPSFVAVDLEGEISEASDAAATQWKEIK